MKYVLVTNKHAIKGQPSESLNLALSPQVTFSERVIISDKSLQFSKTQVFLELYSEGDVSTGLTVPINHVN